MQLSIIPINHWYFELRAPFYLKNDFKFPAYSTEWNVYLKRYTKVKTEDYLYQEEVEGGFLFGVGWAPYILFHYGDYLDATSKEYCRKILDPIVPEFKGLRGKQEEDVIDLLRFNRGIFQVYTGYGKTEVIAKLINYIVNERKEHLLLLTPDSTSLNEIDNRVEKLYGITHEYIDYDALYNAVNVNGFPRSYQFERDNPYWQKVKWIIAEEAEYVINDSGSEVIELCTNSERLYAFSATADKKRAERIRMREGNIPVVQRNKYLINYFGFATVFRKPEDFIIYVYEIKTTIFNDINDNPDASTDYTEIIYSIFTDKRFCEGLAKIAYKEKPIYIPMGRLAVIDEWIPNYFNKEDSVVINICGRGYELYIGGVFQDTITIDELKEFVEDERVDIITGTKSSYRALDLPKLNKVLPLTSQLASNVIQAIGRVTRLKEFTIINLTPFNSINVYSADLWNRKQLIDDYYSECKLIKLTKKESDYGIY